MAFANGTTVTVTRRTAGGTDAYGNPTFTTTTHTIDNCGVAPRQEGDATDHGRQGVIVGVTLYAPFGADIQADDTVTIDGEVFRIEGDPGSWQSPYTGVGRVVQVALTRTEG